MAESHGSGEFGGHFCGGTGSSKMKSGWIDTKNQLMNPNKEDRKKTPVSQSATISPVSELQSPSNSQFTLSSKLSPMRQSLTLPAQSSASHDTLILGCTWNAINCKNGNGNGNDNCTLSDNHSNPNASYDNNGKKLKVLNKDGSLCVWSKSDENDNCHNEKKKPKRPKRLSYREMRKHPEMWQDYLEQLRRTHWEDHYGYESPIEFENSDKYRNNGLFDPYFYSVDYREFENRYKSDLIDKEWKNSHRNSHYSLYDGWDSVSYRHSGRNKRRRKHKIKKKIRRQRLKDRMDYEYNCRNCPIKSFEKTFKKTNLENNDTYNNNRNDYYYDSESFIRFSVLNPKQAQKDSRLLRPRTSHGRRRRSFNRTGNPYKGGPIELSWTKYGPYKWQKMYNQKIDQLWKVKYENKQKKKKCDQMKGYTSSESETDNERESEYESEYDTNTDECKTKKKFKQKEKIKLLENEDEILNNKCFEPSDIEYDSDISENESDISENELSENERKEENMENVEYETIEEKVDQLLSKESKEYDVYMECEILFKGIPWINSSKIPTMKDLENVLRSRQRNRNKVSNKTQYNLDKIYVKLYGKLKSAKKYTLIDTFNVLPVVDIGSRKTTTFNDIGVNLASNASSFADKKQDSKTNKSTNKDDSKEEKIGLLQRRHTFKLTEKEEKEIRRHSQRHILKKLSTCDLTKGRKSFNVTNLYHDFSKSKLGDAKYALPFDRNDWRKYDYLNPDRRSYFDGMIYNYGSAFQARREKVLKLIEKRSQHEYIDDVSTLLYQATGNRVSVNRELYFVGQRCWEELIFHKMKNFSKNGVNRQMLELLNDAFFHISPNVMNFIFTQWNGIGTKIMLNCREFELMMKPLSKMDVSFDEITIENIRQRLIKWYTLYRKYVCLLTNNAQSNEAASKKRSMKSMKSMNSEKEKEARQKKLIDFENKRIVWKYIDQTSEEFIDNNVSELSLIDEFDELEYLHKDDIFIPFEIIHIISLFAGFYYCKSIKINTNDILFNEHELFLLKLNFHLARYERNKPIFKTTTKASAVTEGQNENTGNANGVTKKEGNDDNEDEREAETDGNIANWSVNMYKTETPTFYEVLQYPSIDMDKVAINGKKLNNKKWKKKHKMKKRDNSIFPTMYQVIAEGSVIFDEDRLIRSKNIGEMKEFQGIRMNAREWEFVLEEIEEVYAEVMHNMFGPGDLDSDASDYNDNDNDYNEENEATYQRQREIEQSIRNEQNRFDGIHDDMENEIAIHRSLQDQKENEKEKENENDKKEGKKEDKDVNINLKTDYQLGGLDDESE